VSCGKRDTKCLAIGRMIYILGQFECRGGGDRVHRIMAGCVRIGEMMFRGQFSLIRFENNWAFFVQPACFWRTLLLLISISR
jgi:hypothetical protein